MLSTNGHGLKRAVLWAILYARVSTDEQARSGYSLAQQLEALREYAAREGYEVLEEVVDPGQSGASLERPGMDRVRDLVASGGISVVLAQDRDRFAREPAYHYLLRREFEEHGTKIRAMNDRGDESPEGELTDGILDQLAKYERAKTTERTRRGRLKKAKEGKIVAAQSRPTYGFQFNEARDGYMVDEATMCTVHRVFSMVGEERMSLHSIKRALEADGIPAPNGGRFWNTNTIRDIVFEDCYRPHSYGEIEEFVSPQVVAALNQSKSYGVCWYNRRRVKTRQVGEDGPEGRRYRRVQQTVWKPREEWVAVPVPDAGIPRTLVDAARGTIQYNRPSPQGTHFFELSGGVFFCGVCGRRMAPNRRRRSPESPYISYYRCNTRHKRGREACSMGKSLRADVIEPLVWAHVCEMIMDPERLQAGLERLIEKERAQTHGDPDREARGWADRIIALERKRSGFQDMAAEGLITFDELRVKLAGLEEDLGTAQRELETLAQRQQRIERLEEDAEQVMRSYAGMMPENLLTLEPKERHEIYRMLRLRVAAYPDGTLLASGALGEADNVYTTESTSRCYGPSTRGYGLPGSSIHLSGRAESQGLGNPFTAKAALLYDTLCVPGKAPRAAERKMLASEIWQFLMVVLGFIIVALLWLFVVYLPGRTMERWEDQRPDRGEGEISFPAGSDGLSKPGT